MKIYNTDQLDDIKDPERRQIVYNGFDSMLTLEIFDIVKPYAKDGTYRYSKRMQGPAMTMMRRGIRVNAREAQLLIEGDPDSTDEKCKLGLRARAFKLGGLAQRLKGKKNPKREWYVADENAALQRLAKAAWGKPLNYNSEKQMKAFFYDALMIKPIYINKAGKRTISTGREALEKLQHLETRAIPFATIIIKLREFAKMEDVLTKSLSPEGRWRCSYNVVGTDTWRWSSKKHPLGDGSNNQNIDPELRNVFEADPGMVLINCDQQGAEARVVAYKSGDENYIKAVESGDVHTMVCSMTWKFEPKRELAEREFYRKKSYRDISKKLTHGCLTGDHEVLTLGGWKNISKVSLEDKVACYDKSNEVIDFRNPTQVVAYPYVGNLYTFKGTAYDLTATHDHRMPYQHDGGGMREDIAESVAGRASAKLPYAGYYVGGQEVVSGDEARLIAAIQCDGYVLDGAAHFHLKRPRKITRLKELLKRLNFKYWEGAGDRAKGTTKIRIGKRSYVAEKKYAGAWMLNWPKEALAAWLDELPFWDGHHNKSGTISFSSVNLEHLGWIRTIAALVGKGSVGQGTYVSGYGSKIGRISINNRKYAAVKSMDVTSENSADTMVYCLTVPTTFFVVRRDGNIMITGNTSYDGKAKTLAKQGRVPLDLVEDFQRIFGRVFPGIKDWQIWVKERIETDGSLTTLMGMTRKFWGRRSDDATHRAAIAFEPQNTVGVMTALGLYKLWSTYEPLVQILQNGHDAVLCQVPIERLDELLPLILECLKTPVEVTDIKGNTRLMTIPWDAAVGFNWGKYVKADPIKGTPEKNLKGLREWKDKSKLPSSLIRTVLQATSTPPCQTPT